MPIIYALIARGSNILCEYSTSSGNFHLIAKKLLENISPYEPKKSYAYDHHIFNYLVDDEITYLCMSDEDFGQIVPFSFLNDIQNRFKAAYGNLGKTAAPFSMNEDFSRILQNQMTYFSTSQSSTKIQKIKGDVDELKSVMVENIEKVVDRGERIELLVGQTETLQNHAIEFKKQSSILKKKMWWKNVKLLIILFFLLLIISYFIVAIFCGFGFQDCRRSRTVKIQ
eukprot:TRINITY_DN5311_c0_g1_i1.p1 TRINITY_DN5311_c0_g1~~TRINITY_DN5311_c0_g1_i1.p1  ORF type:complete len:226 (+),score=40.21 TRINITY_DN5311_c0_g1_i1:42-719(+)